MNKQAARQSFLGGTATLAAAVIIVKILGALYKIPLTNVLDGDGMGYFTTAYNIYNLLLTISTAGLPVALSKMIAEANTLGRQNEKRRIFRVALATFLVLGGVCTCLMAFLPHQLAVLMNNSQSWYAIVALAPAVIGVCCESAFRGYTQGHGDMRPTAYSQVIESVFKLVLGLAIAIWMLRAGFSVAQAAGGTILGVTTGSIVGMLYLIVNHMRHRRNNPVEATDVPPSPGRILARILRIGIPIMLGSSVLALITLIDTKLVMLRLQTAAGFDEATANWLFGAYSSTMTFYNLPAAFIVPITTAVIPAISAALAERDNANVMRPVSASSRLTALIAFPCGIGLMVLAGPILRLLYFTKPELCTAGEPLLKVLGLAAIFVCLMLVTNAHLQSFGRVIIPVYTMIVGGAAKVAANWFLVGNPDIGIHGAPIGTTLCFIIITVINFVIVGRMLPERLKAFSIFVKPLIAALIMGAAAWGVYGLCLRVLANRISSAFLLNAGAVVAALIVAVIVYLILIVVLRAVSRSELEAMGSKGAKLAKLLHLR